MTRLPRWRSAVCTKRKGRGGLRREGGIREYLSGADINESIPSPRSGITGISAIGFLFRPISVSVLRSSSLCSHFEDLQSSRTPAQRAVVLRGNALTRETSGMPPPSTHAKSRLRGAADTSSHLQCSCSSPKTLRVFSSSGPSGHRTLRPVARCGVARDRIAGCRAPA